MVKITYTVIYYLLSPLMCVRWFFKSLKPPQYREPFRQRFGFVAWHQQTDIWFHAVSMGETSGAVSIIKRLLETNSTLKIVVTTTTPTGAKLLHEQLGSKVIHYYSPCDLPGTIKRFIKRISPKMVVVMETELWPNWLDHLNKKNIPIILANARMSESSARKYLCFPQTTRQLFSNLTKVLSVNQADARRFIQLGVFESNLQITGNIKFDAQFPSSDPQDYFPFWEQCFVWIAASTHQGEDELVLKTHKKLLEYIPEAKLILVPRHPERFQQVATQIEKQGFKFSRRSNSTSWSEQSQVLLGDSMGELLAAYQKAKVAFIGGSLVNIGGHNAIEAAYYAKPIITGPNYHNFQYLFDSLLERKAAVIVENANDLVIVLEDMADDLELVQAMGKTAKAFVESNQGALDKVLTVIQSTLKSI